LGRSGHGRCDYSDKQSDRFHLNSLRIELFNQDFCSGFLAATDYTPNHAFSDLFFSLSIPHGSSSANAGAGRLSSCCRSFGDRLRNSESLKPLAL
jgi:hypothetical protein